MKDFSNRLSSLTPEQKALFESRLKRRAASHPKPARSAVGSIPKRKRQNHCVLSFDQERIWIIDRMEPGNPAYNIYTASRLLGPLNIDLMERAVNKIVERHEILRTTFSTVEGEPVMVISPESTLKIPVRDITGFPDDQRLSEAIRVVNEATALPFDLEEGPLLRVGIVKVAADEHVVHITMHHTITDRWSAAVLEQEMVAIYSAFLDEKPSPLPPVDIQFADFAEWQREYLQGEVLAAKVDYWKNQLMNAPLVLDVPADRPRPPFQKFRGARELINLPEPLLKALKAFTQGEGATMFMTLLAAYNLLLYRYTGQEDILVGLAMANRNRPETENMLGYLLNMVIIRSRLSARTSFRELLAIVRQSAVGAFANLDLPLGSLIEELKPSPDPSRNPIFQVAYIYLDFPEETGMESLKLRPMALEADNGSSRFDMTLALTELPDRLETLIEYNTDLFNSDTIKRMLVHLSVLLEGIVSSPDRALGELPMLTAVETKHVLEDWNNTDGEFPRHRCVQQLAEMAASESPDSIAVATEEYQLSYTELNVRANQLAHYLMALGVGESTAVAVCLGRSAELIIALLAVLKAGAAYVPLDPGYPIERIAYMLDDSRCQVVISEEAFVDSLPSHWGLTVSLDGDWGTIEAHSVENTQVAGNPDSAAYVIYTSGSTGGPRGVSVPHRAINRLVLNSNYVRLGPDSIVAQCSNASFDAATFEIWGALLNGSRLVVIDKNIALSPREFSDEIRCQCVTVLFLTTALFNEIARHSPSAFGSLECLLFGGEAVTPGWVKTVIEAAPPENLLHVYGPTENTTFSSFFPVESVAGDQTIPIGLPISNTKIYVVDRNFNHVPAGVYGELLIEGDGLAHCYLNRAELTAEKFIPEAFSATPGQRLYRSGDLVRRRPDGNILFVGRNDFQVKVRGFRIELEEVESAIREHSAVEDAVVALSGGGNEGRLVAYVVPRPGSEITISGLRRFLAGRLPEYMAPSALIEMDSLPLNSNGKVDRSRLPDADLARPDLVAEYLAPRTQIETSLCDVWAGVLGLDRVGVRDNFFDLGGDSIRSIQIMSRCEEAGCVFSIQELFQNPTIETLASIVESRDQDRQAKAAIGPFSMLKEEDRARLPESIEDAYPLTMLQAGMIFHTELAPLTPVYHDIFSFHIRAPLDVPLIRESLKDLVKRHGALRTSFELTGLSEPLQIVHKEAELAVRFDDISAFDDRQQRDFVSELIEAEKNTRFSWDLAPLARLWIHKRSEESFQFTLSFHHAILDGWSLATFISELFGAYAAGLSGLVKAPRPKLNSSFRDFVALEIEAVESEQQRDFWIRHLDEAPFTGVLRTGASQTTEPSGKIGVRMLELPEELTRNLAELAHRLGVPLKSVLLAAHAKVLALLSGSNDVVTGAIFNGRPEERDAETVLGLFLNTLPLRMRLKPSATWEELALAAFDAERELLPYRRYPMAEMQRVTGRSPLFETAFNYTHFHAAGGILGVDGMEILEDQTVSETNFPFLLDFDLDPVSSALQAAIKYDSAQFDPGQIELIAGYYARALQTMPERPGQNHAAARLLSEAEIDVLVRGLNSTEVDYGTYQPVDELVCEQTRLTPDAAALVSGDLHLSYAAVNREANNLASRLVRLGVGPETGVGLALDRSPSMCMAILAILKAGAAYVPLDAAFPPERLKLMLDAVETLITQTRYAELFAGMGLQGTNVLCLDRTPATPPELEDVFDGSEEAVLPRADADSLAYVIFTSGSTGTPKGVAISHRVATNMVRWNKSTLEPGRLVLQFASPSFDVAFQEIFSTWTSGGTLLLISDDERRDTAALADFIIRRQVDRIFLPGVALQQLAEQLLIRKPELAVKEVVTAGEQLKVSPEVRRLSEKAGGLVLHNHYGPSETHVATAFEMKGRPESWPDLPPIGAPIANASIHLLNENLEVAPPGVPAEIFIGGEIVGRGYLHRPDLTAPSFLCDPFDLNGSRLYRTGDLGRCNPDGQIEFLGRLDHQVKVRGVRVELGEIETSLSSHRCIGQAAVAAFDSTGGKRLVAFLVPAENVEVDLNELTLFLKRLIPEYMCPSEYVLLEKLPLTATGKLDRRALRPPAAPARVKGAEYVGPASRVEEVVAGIWSEVLHQAQISTRANFFDLGGHSLTANQIVSRIRNLLHSEIPLKALFEHPTIAELSAYIDGGPNVSPAATAGTIAPRDAASSYPLSIAQRRQWFLEQLDPHQGAYHIAVSLWLSGDLNVGTLDQALAEIVRRHEVLRSRVFTVEGTPFQSVESLTPCLHSLDLTALGNQKRESAARELVSLVHARVFDLGEAPLLRTWLIKVRDRESILAVTMHHMISDGWSMGIFSDELGRLYQYFSEGGQSGLAALPIQYRDFAVWQNDSSKTERFELELSYWRRQLGGRLPVLDIPSDRTRPSTRTFNGETISHPLDAGARNAMRNIADTQGATLFMVYLSALFALLYRYTGQADLIVGAPISGRNRPEIERLIGFFVNTLAFRVEVSGSLSFRELLRRVREVALEAYANQDVPFELLVEKLQPERDPSRSPIFDVVFDLQVESGAPRSRGNLRLLPFQHDNRTSKFDLTLSVADSATDPALTLEFSTDLFERSSIARFATHFDLFVKSGAASPDAPLALLAFMPDAEIREILEEFNDSRREYPDRSCIHELFELEAARRCDAIAVACEEEEVTYGVLLQHANGLSRLLAARGVTVESRVGICLPRSIDMIVSLLAVLKTGGAYVPIDSSYPQSRLDFIVADAEIDLLLTSSAMVATAPTASDRIIRVDQQDYGFETGAAYQAPLTAFPDSLAYVIYTSGTTGSPKGVAVTHRGVVRLVKGANYAAFDDQQVFLQLSTVSFDVATFEIWGPLLNGGKLVLMGDEMASLEDIKRAIGLHGISTLWLTAGLFHLMVDRLPEALYPVRQLLAGGEALQADHVNRFVAGAGPGRLINGYGPTEVTTFTSSYRFDGPVDASRAVPIGRPISNTTVYLLDQWLNPVPLLVKGELYASGPGLARGYLNAPDLTAEKFLLNPYPTTGGDRMYATGDLGSYLRDGSIEFLGRVDSQIKLRGFRIELGEIESVLASLPDVSRAVVVVQTDQSGERRLAAYATAKAGAALTPEALRARAKNALPDFMVPSSFVVLDALPLTRSGKIDHKALPAPKQAVGLAEKQFEPPRNPIEEGLAKVWSLVLGRERIGIQDDFFDLGGHSLLATQVVSRIREAFQVDLPLRTLFENRTVERLGAAVETLLLDKLDSLSEEEAANLLG